MVRALIRRFVDSVADGQKSRLKVVFSDLRPPDNTTYDSKHLDDLDVTIIFRNRWATWRSSASKACAGWSISDSLKRRMLIRALRAFARYLSLSCAPIRWMRSLSVWPISSTSGSAARSTWSPLSSA
ncbi:hypothetical protein LJR084_006178 [Variovorax sp. LjRoot84]